MLTSGERAPVTTEQEGTVDRAEGVVVFHFRVNLTETFLRRFRELRSKYAQNHV